jgi:DnaA family protein
VVNAARRNGRHTAWFDAETKVIDIADDALCAADNVHLLGAEAQIALFNLHNRVRGGNGVLIASGDAAPAQLRLRPDLVTRLASGLIYQVHGLDDGEKSAVLRRHADMRGFRLSQEVADYLLRRSRRDMPSLLAVLDALDRYSLETKRPITVPLLRDLLNEHGTTNGQK